MRLVRHVAHIEERRNAYKILVRKPEGRRSHGRDGCRWQDNTLQLILKKQDASVLLDSVSSGWCPVVGSCEYSNELLDSIKDGEFLDQLRFCHLLKEFSLWCWLALFVLYDAAVTFFPSGRNTV
jgi:hypothetical protein